MVANKSARKTLRARLERAYPKRAPACFDSQDAWNLYRASAVNSADKDANYCTDCTPERQAKMKTVGRCAHPLIEFVLVQGILIGQKP